MRYTEEMKQKGMEPMTWELDIFCESREIERRLTDLWIRCYKDPNCPKKYLDKINSITDLLVVKVLRDGNLLNGCIDKNPTYNVIGS